MPVGIGFGRDAAVRAGVVCPTRFSAPRGFHPGALWLAAAIPAVATVLLIARLAA